MTSFMASDGVTLYLRLKDVTNTCKHVRHSPTIGGNYSVQWQKIRNRSVPVRKLLSNTSLFVGQLYEDKSLALCDSFTV